jgi:hypothetical protein
MANLHLRDALTLMGEKDQTGKPLPFSLVCYTHNRKTKEGGRRVEIPQATWLTEDALANPRTYTQRQESRKARSGGKLPAGSKGRPGDHWRNATRNLLLPNGDIHKCIIWLITEFNGQRVVY